MKKMRNEIIKKMNWRKNCRLHRMMKSCRLFDIPTLSDRTVRRILDKWADYCDVNDLERSGRPRIDTVSKASVIRRTLINNKFRISARQIANQHRFGRYRVRCILSRKLNLQGPLSSNNSPQIT